MTHRSFLYIRYTLIVAVLFLTACSHLPIKGQSVTSLSSVPLSRIDSSHLYAADRSGSKVAFADNGLAVVNILTGKRQAFADTSPVAVGWSPTGALLAAAFPMQQSNRVKVFDSQGLLVAEREIPGRISGIFWRSPQELYVITAELTSYRFGISYRLNLYCWQIGTDATVTILHETTIMPSFQEKYGTELLQGIIRPVLSPLGDELLYSKLMNPPAFSPYRKLIVRNLLRSTEQEIASVGLAAAGAMFSYDSEDVIYSDTTGDILQRKIWGGDTVHKLGLSGMMLAGSGGGHYLLTDGHLNLDGLLIATLPNRSESTFIPHGRLLVAWDKILYLVQGLEPDDADLELTPQQLDKLTNIRSWRADGLITPDEYSESRKKLLQK